MWQYVYGPRAERVRVLELQPADRRAAHVHHDQPRPPARDLVERLVRMRGLGEAAHVRLAVLRVVGAAPARSRAPPTGAGRSCPSAAARTRRPRAHSPPLRTTCTWTDSRGAGLTVHPEGARHAELAVPGHGADHRVAAGRQVDAQVLAVALQEAVGAGQLVGLLARVGPALDLEVVRDLALVRDVDHGTGADRHVAGLELVVGHHHRQVGALRRWSLSRRRRRTRPARESRRHDERWGGPGGHRRPL